ncbi:unnamed protein product [Vicia faba]|uniref:Disease resistance N-terminal domain-containing protein n=1 Tax=Vicia faba TaxID=3906 RepID=A0AAV1ACQ7_VICFA|nr:unnamed protein product [Vicia faba]
MRGQILGTIEVDRFCEIVESIKVVLLDAELKQEQNHVVQNWIGRLNDVLHPADDLLDEFVIQDMRHKMEVQEKNKVSKLNLSQNVVVVRKTNEVRREISPFFRIGYHW